MSSLYEHLLKQQSPQDKEKLDGQGQSKRLVDQATPRFKLKLQRHISEVSASSVGDGDVITASAIEPVSTEQKASEVSTGSAGHCGWSDTPHLESMMRKASEVSAGSSGDGLLAASPLEPVSTDRMASEVSARSAGDDNLPATSEFEPISTQRKPVDVTPQKVRDGRETPLAGADTSSPMICEGVPHDGITPEGYISDGPEFLMENPPTNKDASNLMLEQACQQAQKEEAEGFERMMHELFSDEEGDSASSALAVSSGAASATTAPALHPGKFLITSRDDFNLVQQCAAVGCTLTGKTPLEALQALLDMMEEKPDDATWVGLDMAGKASTKASLEDTLAVVRECVKDARCDDVCIMIERRLRPDTNWNMHFTCKWKAQQVGSCVFKPTDNDPTLFHQVVAIRVALAWRCIPLLCKHKVVRVRSGTVAMELANCVRAWLNKHDLLGLAHIVPTE